MRNFYKEELELINLSMIEFFIVSKLNFMRLKRASPELSLTKFPVCTYYFSRYIWIL